jgi:prevent-host-death family protein
MKQPKQRQVGAGEFKVHCLQIMDEVSRSRAQVVITKHGKPFAKLVPYSEEPNSLYGCMGDSVVIHGNVIDAIEEVWDVDSK